MSKKQNNVPVDETIEGGNVAIEELEVEEVDSELEDDGTEEAEEAIEIDAECLRVYRQVALILAMRGHTMEQWTVEGTEENDPSTVDGLDLALKVTKNRDNLRRVTFGEGTCKFRHAETTTRPLDYSGIADDIEDYLSFAKTRAERRQREQAQTEKHEAAAKAIREEFKVGAPPIIVEADSLGVNVQLVGLMPNKAREVVELLTGIID